MRLQFWKKPPAPIAEDAIVMREPSGVASIGMIARPLVVSNGQDPIEYAKFRLEHLAAHIEQNAGSLTAKWWDEARTETYALLHALRVHGAIGEDEEWGHLLRVVASLKPKGPD